MSLEDLSAKISAARAADLLDSTIAFGELTVTVKLDALVNFVDWLRLDPACKFSTLIDITAVDHPERVERFAVVYHFLSMYTNARIRVKSAVAEGQMVPTLTVIHPTANWFEREVFDMFGIIFSGHPDMRRILTDYGFRGYPLRKDFPTTGYTEVRYDEGEKRVVYEPVKLVQDYRQFDFMSPWEGAQYILPGDEKKGA
ncbi:NADH-quinone oxidoreductase subunit C [Frigidibacter sp. RF13]|uniref:NADH-quinone oxidoreductase subunit C n=1 Tax=Frigidibacter sp. RF13 TaxID=2997340 RepID=UPI0022719D3D|nr:NADH-quinone oxidoreductase subunit C [Frigidibacter sp. RF13]MCY1125940.1 NADH-quinone oxidoreductase subunit C [Frigidibacter sp. RF13]